jgi:hypothetical protein
MCAMFLQASLLFYATAAAAHCYLGCCTKHLVPVFAFGLLLLRTFHNQVNEA